MEEVFLLAAWPNEMKAFLPLAIALVFVISTLSA